MGRVRGLVLLLGGMAQPSGEWASGLLCVSSMASDDGCPSLLEDGSTMQHLLVDIVAIHMYMVAGDLAKKYVGAGMESPPPSQDPDVAR